MSLKLVVPVAAALTLAACWMLPVDPVEYDYSVAKSEATLAFLVWPETDEYDYYGDVTLWVFGVMNGPPMAEAISATRYGWSESEPDPYDLELPDGVFLELYDEFPLDNPPSEVAITVGDAASHILAVAGMPDGSRYFYCFCRDDNQQYSVPVWWRSDPYYNDDPLPDQRGVRFPRQISDLAYAGGSLFVAIVQSEETLLVLDTAAATVEEYQIPNQNPRCIAADSDASVAYVGFYTEDVIAVFDLATRAFLSPLTLPDSSSSPDLYDLEFVQGTDALAILRSGELAVEPVATWAGAAIEFATVLGYSAAVDESRGYIYTLEFYSNSKIRSYGYTTIPLFPVDESTAYDFGTDIVYCPEADRIIASVEVYRDYEWWYDTVAFDPDGLWLDQTLFSTEDPPGALCSLPESPTVLYVTEESEDGTSIVSADARTGQVQRERSMPETDLYGAYLATSSDGQTIVGYGHWEDSFSSGGAFHIWSRAQLVGTE